MTAVAGKIIGVVLGFVFSGPMGAIVGFIIGHMYDAGTTARIARSRDQPMPAFGLKDTLEQSTFMTGVIILGAKMAKADGRVSREEIAAFKRAFRIQESEAVKVGRLFDQARLSSDGYEPYAARLAQVFRNKPAVLEDIMNGLFVIAGADNVMLSVAEGNFLRRVGSLFGFALDDFMRLAAKAGVRLPEQTQPQRHDPYAALGLREQATDEDIKRTYRVLIRKYHPDKLSSQGATVAAVAQATEKMKTINAAYGDICKLRGMK